MQKKTKNDHIKSYVLLLVAIAMIILGLKVMKAPTPITLIAGGTITAILALCFGTKWEEIQKAMVEMVGMMALGLFLLIAIGLLVASWIQSGTVPMMIYYGLKFISPSVFLLVTCITCSLMSLMTGSSWGTIGTVGVALIGVAQGLGVPLPYTAGAIVAGAMFGDKMSPLSDTTIMAPALSGVKTTDHIRHMLYTTTPGYIISLALFIVLGMRHGDIAAANASNAQVILDALQAHFQFNPLLLLPPVLLLFLIYKGLPSLPVFCVGIILGCLFAGIFQGDSPTQIASALNNGYHSTTGVELVDNILSRGGLKSMLGTLSIILAAAVFGAPLKAAGVLQALVESLSASTRNWKTVMTGCYATNLIFLMITTSYYVCFTVLGPMLQPVFDSYGIPKKNLSRMLEDTGTSICWIIPWGMSGIFASGVLGVPVLDYAAYAPITYLGFVFALLYVYSGRGFGIGEIATPEPDREATAQALVNGR